MHLPPVVEIGIYFGLAYAGAMAFERVFYGGPDPDKSHADQSPFGAARHEIVELAADHGRLTSKLGPLQAESGNRSLSDQIKGYDENGDLTIEVGLNDVVDAIMSRYDQDEDGEVDLSTGEHFGVDEYGDLRTLAYRPPVRYAEDSLYLLPYADADGNERVSAAEVRAVFAKFERPRTAYFGLNEFTFDISPEDIAAQKDVNWTA